MNVLCFIFHIFWSTPPISLIERRRAAREQRRQEQQRRREEAEAAQREASANQEETNPTGESSGDADGAPNQPAGSDKPQNNDKAENEEGEESKRPKGPSEEELQIKRETELEEKLAADAKEYLQSTVKESLCRVSLDIIEKSASFEKQNLDNTQKDEKQADVGVEGDSQSVIIVMVSKIFRTCLLIFS